jgi:hypothetical protein
MVPGPRLSVLSVFSLSLLLLGVPEWSAFYSTTRRQVGGGGGG